MADRSDGELLRAADRDPKAFGTFYDRHAGDLKRWFHRRVDCEVVATDLLAELFAQAWLSRARFRDEEDGNARPWLIGISRNLLAAYRRRNRVETRARSRLGMRIEAEHDCVDEVHSRLEAEAAAPYLDTAMSGLPPGQRAALRLRVIDELPYDVVANDLRCTGANARKRVSQGLRTLRLQLGAEP
jgi:RNA polymerase sigma factor (sigma-70 family)